MAEDNNQDMAMEDILSSIKNILEEDEAGRTAENVPAEEPLIDEEAEVNVDDILELSPDMKIDGAPETAVADPAPESINLEAELNNVRAPELEETGFQINDSEAQSQGVQTNVGLGWEDFESDPFDAEAKVSPVEDLIEAEEQPVLPVEEEPAVTAQEAVIEHAAENQPQPVTPSEPETVYEPEPEVVAEPEPQPVRKAEEPAADAVDVSANIINNFAKMFSHAEPKAEPAPVAELPAEPVRAIGDGAKTIEDVVADVIRRIIGAEVEKNWRGQADYDTYAREVIAAQAKAWLDANLPSVVEAIVKQEIERVMAKVGNNQ